jgi:hypothetical protein
MPWSPLASLAPYTSHSKLPFLSPSSSSRRPLSLSSPSPHSLSRDLLYLSLSCPAPLLLLILHLILLSLLPCHAPLLLLLLSLTYPPPTLPCLASPPPPPPSETSQVLDPDEMLSLNITLTRRPPDDTIQTYTEASYLATCTDIGLFFHDTWSHLRLSRATGNGAMNLLISPETNESSIFEVMSSLAKQLLLNTSSDGNGNGNGKGGGGQQQSIDDFDDFMTPSPSRLGTRRTRGDSLDETEGYSMASVSVMGGASGGGLYPLPSKQRGRLYSSDEQENNRYR